MFALEGLFKGVLYLGVVLGMDNAYKLTCTEYSFTLAIVVYGLIGVALFVDFCRFFNGVRRGIK